MSAMQGGPASEGICANRRAKFISSVYMAAMQGGPASEGLCANRRAQFKVLLIATVVGVFILAMSSKTIPINMLAPLSSSRRIWDQRTNLSGNVSLESLVAPRPKPSAFNATHLVAPKPEPAAFNATHVMIVTYFRSGSSLTGEVMQRHADAFYVFEPLRVVQTHARKVSYVIDKVREVTNYDPVRLRYDIIEGWLTCNFSKIPVQAFFDVFLKYGTKSSTVLPCMKAGARQPGARQPHKIRACILALQRQCAQSKYRIIKLIRMRMDQVVNVTMRIPNLKVIHLVRDPRGTVESRKNRRRCKNGLPECAKPLCADLQTDIDVKQEHASIARRTFTVRYEDMANSPIETSRLLYNFTGIPFLESIQEYILNLTHGSSTIDCKVCKEPWQLGRAHRTVNASSHVSMWKDRWNRTDIDEVQHICSKVMHHYNYELQ